MLKTLRLRHFFGAIAATLGVAAVAFAAAVIIFNPSGVCALEGSSWATVTGADGTSSCQDMATKGLVWSSSYIGRAGGVVPNYDIAATACSNLVEGGYTDWRLPTIKEVQAAASHGAYTHVSNSWLGSSENGVFTPGPYTSPTIISSDTKGNAWVYFVSLVDGTTSRTGKQSATDSRCVRP